MREIKFRGRRTDNNEWVYGSLCQAFGGYSIMPSCFFGTEIFDEHENSNREEDGLALGGWFSVIADTIGQYTGINDKNGLEMHEGDIIERLYRYVIQFKDGVYFGYNPKGSLSADEIKHDMTIIGNIYNNPQLLKHHHDKSIQHQYPISCHTQSR